MTEDFYCDEVLSGKNVCDKDIGNRTCSCISPYETILSCSYCSCPEKTYPFVTNGDGRGAANII